MLFCLENKLAGEWENVERRIRNGNFVVIAIIVIVGLFALDDEDNFNEKWNEDGEIS